MAADEAAGEVTRLLSNWSSGDLGARDAVLPLVYDELRRLAASYLRRERSDHTLQATALVHEAYLRLVDHQHADWHNRQHFFGAAAQLMRRILVDHARGRLAAKRGRGASKVELHEAMAMAQDQPADMLTLDESLTRLARLDPQQAQIVELRVFTGLTVEETADLLKISPATVKRDWSMAKVWLLNQIQKAAKA